MLNTTNLDYFSAQHQAEIFRWAGTTTGRVCSCCMSCVCVCVGVVSCAVQVVKNCSVTFHADVVLHHTVLRCIAQRHTVLHCTVL